VNEGLRLLPQSGPLTVEPRQQVRLDVCRAVAPGRALYQFPTGGPYCHLGRLGSPLQTGWLPYGCYVSIRRVIWKLFPARS